MGNGEIACLQPPETAAHSGECLVEETQASAGLSNLQPTGQAHPGQQRCYPTKSPTSTT